MVWWILAAVNLAFVLGIGSTLIWGDRRIGWLADVPLGPPTGGSNAKEPRVSVIVAARNEERNIEAAAESLLNLDYADYELLVVDDRSTDSTGAILDCLAQRDLRLKVVHLTELPPGWLGKNHALDVGAQRATGEFLLFTDADVVLDPTTLRRAMTHVQRTDADHLAVSPDPEMPSLLLESLVVVFVHVFFVYIRPWKVDDPKSPAFVGVGAFNLLKREVYEAVGTMRAIAMRPDDDVKLGKLIKRKGFRQRFLAGRGLVRVPWYASLREMMIGLEKNLFAGVDYSLAISVAGTSFFLFVYLWPFVALLFLRGPAWWMSLAATTMLLWQALRTARATGCSRWSVVLFPLAVVLFVFVQWRAITLTYVRGGIRWRDTHYPLAELRANKV